MLSQKKALKLYKSSLKKTYGNLLNFIESEIKKAAKDGKTEVYIFVDFCDFIKNGHVVDFYTFFESLGYIISIDDYVVHADSSKDGKEVVKYLSESLKKSLDEQGVCKGGLLTIQFS